MKKLWHLINLFEIKISTILLLVLAMLFGRIKLILILFLIAFIHESFHMIVALLLKVKVKIMVILPFGAKLEIEEVESLPSFKQILIYSAGPLSVFFNLIWINMAFHLSWMNSLNYQYFLQYNYLMCIVNLLPIYPLDGYMIIKAIFQLIFSYQKALKCSIGISLLTFLCFLLYNFYSLQIMITLFLLLQQIKHFKEYKRLYQQFLIYKTNYKKQKNYKIINNYQMYKDSNNYQFENDKILNDVDIAYHELRNYAKKYGKEEYE